MFERTPDQQLFEDTTRRFIETACPLEGRRTLAGTKAGYEPDYWRRGAELGWTSLLVPESGGGGSVSGHPVLDLALVAYQFGLHAAPGPLLGPNLVAAALARSEGGPDHDAVLAQLLSGDTVAGWAWSEPPPADEFGRIDARAQATPDGFVLTASKGPVEAGPETAWFLVTARHEDGLSQFLVSSDTPGLNLTPLEGVDLTRRFCRLDLDGVHLPGGALVGGAGTADQTVAWLVDVALVVQLAEMVGAMQWAFDTTLEWVSHRYSFGRPLASYQEIKHRFADMKMWLEASYAVTGAAARAVDAGSESAAELLSAAKLYVGKQGSELVQDCVQLHGGIGVTFEHDLHLFLRRVTTGAVTLGTPPDHAERLADLVSAQAGPA